MQYNPNNRLPTLLLAGGVGFAPFKAILEETFQATHPPSYHLYWGVNHREDLYFLDTLTALSKCHPHFQLTPILLYPDAHWSGAIGYIHDHFLSDYPHLAHYQAYVSGPLLMVLNEKKQLLEAGLSTDHFHSDLSELMKHEPR